MVKITQVRKRDGSLIDFNPKRIEGAILKALTATEQGDGKLSKELTEKVINLLQKRSKTDISSVEEIQDTVEEILILEGYTKTAKAYILYREQHRRVREAKEAAEKAVGMVDQYLQELDWEVNENSNMAYSLQGLNNYVTSSIVKKYWLNRIYPPEIRKANEEGNFHIHDLQALAPYCVGWDLYDLLLRGFGGVFGKIESKPPKHFSPALGQIVNFFYTLQGEAAGAVALSSFDTLLAPFIYYDQLSYPEVKQDMQEFLFNCNVPTRVGFQCISEDTEILTSRGWKNYKEVNKGDIIKTFNLETNQIENQKVTFIFKKYYKGIMYRLRNRIQDQLISPKHKVVRRKFQTNKYVLEPIEDILKLKSPFVVPIAGKNTNKETEIDDNQIKLMAWIISEGTIERPTKYRCCYRVSIYQSKEKNRKNYNEIINLLKYFKLNYSEYETASLGDNVQRIRLDAESSRKIHQWFGTKNNVHFIPDNLLNLSERQSRLFLNTYLKADGFEECKISTVDLELLDDLQTIVTNCGYGFTVLKRKPTIGKKDIYVLRIIKHKETYVRKIERINYKGVIWSPHTKNETIIAKRKGKVFITGNTPFENLTLDLKVPEHYKLQPVMIGGKTQEKTYGEFQDQMDMINKAFAEVMMEGDAKGRPFTFPIPTYNITPDFDWENPVYEPILKMTAKYGIPYFANFINSEMKPEDVRSMCCRLRLDNRQLYKRGGGLFGSNPLTGSIGVVTLNLPRIGYLSKTKKEFFERLEKLMDLAKESLKIKRKTLERFTENGLYPYSRYYLDGIKKMRGKYWANHFSTIGLIGMNEALLNFKQVGANLGTKVGQEFAQKVLDFMREKMIKYQAENGDLFNLEATPAEGTSYRLAKIDKEKYPDIITAGKEKPYYTNSSQLPVNLTDDLFEALKLQDNLQTKYTGGCIAEGNKVLTDKGLLPIEYIVKNFDKLKPIKAVSYNKEEGISEWDKILEAVSIDVKKHNKIRIKGERNLDITTSDWHPFFVLEKIKVNPTCPVCKEKVGNIKGFAAHLRYNLECRKEYKIMPKYQVVERRADKLRIGDYILQNSNNLYPEKETELNNDLMWLVGFFIGDGCISEYIDNRGGNNLKKYKIRFHNNSESALKKASKILLRYFQAKVKVIQNDKRSKLLKEVSTSKKEILEFFFKYGFKTGKKVYNINIPQKIRENLNKNNVFSLLSGLIDSDGHIDKRDGSLEYYTVSPQLADDILEICSRAGIMISKSLKLTKIRNEVNIYRLRIPQYELTKIRDNLNNIVNLQNIKKSLSNRKKRYFPIVRVKEVSKVNVKDNQFYDLMTKKNHNYLAGKNSLVFIHNTVFHAFLGEQISDPKQVERLIKKVFEKFQLPYFTLTPTFSICPVHGYIPGEHFTCPKCIIEQPCEVYSRIVGYLRPIQQWNKGKEEEFKERKEFHLKN